MSIHCNSIIMLLKKPWLSDLVSIIMDTHDETNNSKFCIEILFLSYLGNTDLVLFHTICQPCDVVTTIGIVGNGFVFFQLDALWIRFLFVHDAPSCGIWMNRKKSTVKFVDRKRSFFIYQCWIGQTVAVNPWIFEKQD